MPFRFFKVRKMEKIREVLKNANRVLILIHEHPDGDCLGSSFALRLALKALGKECEVLLDEPVPSCFLGYPMEGVCEPEGTYDLVMALDCGNKDRFQRHVKIFDEAPLTVEIDHHINNPGYADYCYVEPCAATAQLVYELIEALEVPFTKEMALWLYIGLSTDTGGFRFSNTEPKTLRYAAALMETGIDIAKINRVLYDTVSMMSFKLQQKLLETLTIVPEKKCAYGYLNHETLMALGADASHIEGLSRIPVSVEGMELGIFVSELQKGVMKASLRSQEEVDVQRLAAAFGGGGHVRAAGCKIPAETPLDAIKQILERVSPA